MNHGGALLLTLFPWMATLLTAAAICDGYDFPNPPPRLGAVMERKCASPVSGAYYNAQLVNPAAATHSPP